MIMFYLAKFCRICIQTGVELMDIDSTDYDSVKFSEKLKICTQMVITRESLSTKICMSCINKLRASYEFHTMCEKSTTILQQYLTELLSASKEAITEKVILSEIQVNVPTKISKPRRRRVGKDERCSLLRRILSKVTRKQFIDNMHINGLTRLCNRISPSEPILPQNVTIKCYKNKQKKVKPGGLKGLLDFTKDFDFGYDIDVIRVDCKYVDLTPLEQLTNFTENFFCDHFLDYRETIINIGEGLESDCSDEESLFDECAEDKMCVVVKEEIVIHESNLDIKTEIFDEDYQYSSTYVQACYDNNNEIVKTEAPADVEGSDSSNCFVTPPSEKDYLNQDYHFSKHTFDSAANSFKKYRTLSPYSAKCRTRGNPFISPQLKKQFQTRNFKCTVCNRKFKGPGYLKAHCSRFKH